MARADEATVERLTEYIMEVVAECFEEENVSTSDVISALFTVLERTLRGIRKLQEPDERFHNAREIKKVLDELLIEFGRVPS